MDHITLPTPYAIIKKDGNEAVFEIENLYPGYGLTLGNAIRRVLLSSLPGAAITLVKIKGVDHEFSTIPMVQEDVIEILMNLKQIRVRLFGDEPQKIVVKVKGEREVKAGDIEAPSQVEIVNPDAHIVFLTDKKAEFEMELQVDSGIGYQTVEQRHHAKMPIGTIAIDAIFTPIRKVNYQIENMRVGDRTDYNRLRIIIETDGSITPEKAFQDSVNLLIKQFQGLITEKTDTVEASSEGGVDLAGVVSGGDLGELNLSARTVGALVRAGISSIAVLKSKSAKDIESVKGLGSKGVNEIKDELAKLGIELM